MSRFLILFCISFLLSSNIILRDNLQADENSAKKIIDNVKKRYEAITDITARFSQTFYWKLADEKQTINGRIYVRDGKKYRIETTDQVIVTDGSDVWTLSKANKQVVVDALNEDNRKNPLVREFLIRYSEQYVPKLAGEENIDGTGCRIIELTPRNEGMFINKVRIWVDLKTWLMLIVEQTDINENLTTYKVADIDFKTKLDKDLFVMQVPEGYELVDLR